MEYYDINDIAVGDTVKYDTTKYVAYHSFDKHQNLEVIEVAKGPTGNIVFRGRYKPIKSTYYSTNADGYVITPFISIKNFIIVKKAEKLNDAMHAMQAAGIKQYMIMDCGKIVGSANELNVKQKVEEILRKDMNKKLRIYKLESEVSVGELPIEWKKV